MKITYIGHGTVIVDTGNCKFITDPLLVERIARIGPKRKVPLNIEYGALDDIDFITISHGHFDHLDLRSIRKIDRDVPVVCHTALQRLVRKTKHKPIPLKWWDSIEINRIKITAVPSFHFTARPPFQFSPDYQGYVIEAGKTFYHGGDTGMSEFFSEIGQKFKINVAFLPIGAYHPPSFREHHLSPEDALDAIVTMNADLLVPIHWGTYSLSWEPFEEPPKRLLEYAEKKGLEQRVKLLKPGGSFEY